MYIGIINPLCVYSSIGFTTSSLHILFTLSPYFPYQTSTIEDVLKDLAGNDSLTTISNVAMSSRRIRRWNASSLYWSYSRWFYRLRSAKVEIEDDAMEENHAAEDGDGNKG
jgi:hypothetical protein